MSGLEFLGAFDASYGLVSSAYNLLVQLRESWKNSKDVAEKLDELSELAKRTEDAVKRLTAKVSCCSQDALGSDASGIIDVLKEKVDRNVEGAMTALKKLDKYQESSAGPSSGVRRFRHRLRMSRIGMTAKMMLSKSIHESLSLAESCLDKALQEASIIENQRLHIETHRKLDAIRPVQTKEERFVTHFDCPELPDNVVLDFCTMETQEGRLLGKLLALREKESVHGLSAVGRGSATHGMGGVGKTTALRAICHQKKVKEAFPDGICFLEFGQDAKDIDVQVQLEGCINNFGGVSIVTKMEQQSSLEAAVNQAARWLREKAVLFVCDDLWRSAASDYGYLPLLKRLLRYAPRSMLLISTRDKRIAEEVSMSYETFGTLPSHGLSARNLLGQIAFGDRHSEVMKRPELLNYVRTILNICSGLQLALCMAGRALKTAIEEFGDIQKGFDFYASQVERDQRPDETERSAQLYNHGLSYIVEASLIQCGQWAEKSKKKVDVQDFFRSLCVLEKQTAMPKSMLSNFWRLSSRETDHFVRMFTDLGLITRTAGKTHSEMSYIETSEDYEVRLHDLVLKLCQEMAAGEEKRRHGRLIDALKGSTSLWIGEKIPTLDEWWRLKHNGYVYGNLSRHMANSGRIQALANLLSDVRWTLRRLEIGGWLALKTDFQLLLEDDDYAEVADIKQVYEVLERQWSEVSKNERLLAYFIGGSLSQEERNCKYTALFIDSMIRYLSRPLLFPRWKSLVPQDSRELSLLTCPKLARYVCMDFSCSADLAVVGDDKYIWLWSVSAQKALWFMPTKSKLRCVAISAHGRLIVSGHIDGTFRRWDSKNTALVGAQVEAHIDEVTCVAVSKDELTIVTGSDDTTLRLWNAKNGEPKGTPMHHNDVVTSVAICESESMIVSGSVDKTVCRWNIETSEMMGGPMRGHKDVVNCVAVDANGKMIVSGSDDFTLIRWDAKTGEQIGEPMCCYTVPVQCVSISSCGEMILSGSRDCTVQIWNAVNGKPIGEPFRGHLQWIESVAFTEESGIILSGSEDGTIRRWRTVPSARISDPVERCDGAVGYIMFKDGGQKLLTYSTNGTLLQWDAASGKPIGKPMNGRRGDVNCISVNEKCGIVSVIYENFGMKNEIIRWNTSTCERISELKFFNHENIISCAAVSANSEMIVTGSGDGIVQRWCARSGDVIGEPMREHKDYVLCAAFSASDETIVTGSHDGSIIVWTSTNGEQIGKPIFHNASIESVCISADGTVIVSSTRGGGLCRWDAINGRLLGKSVSKELYGAIISTNDDCTKLVTSRNDKSMKSIRYWLVDPGGTIRETSALRLSADVTTCAVDMKHGVVAVGSVNGTIAVCDVHE